MKTSLLVLGAGAALLAAPGVAQASSCSYSSATKTMSVSLLGNFDGAALQGSPGMGSIFVNGMTCGAATIANTNKITVTGDAGANQELLLEMNFPYRNASGDIDFGVDLGGGANDDLRLLNQTVDAKDHWVFGSTGVNVNASELVKDDDVTIGAGTDAFVAQGESGNDAISGAGSFGTGTPFAKKLSISGGEGADQLIGGSAVDSITGDDGDDILNGRAGADALDGGGGVNRLSYASAAGPVTVNLGAGTALGADGADTVKNIQNVFGSAYADFLVGDAGANILRGANGNDILNGRRGKDAMDGGGGIDLASFRTATAGVTANLTSGASSGGDGTDALIAVENLRGSNYADLLAGDANANVLDGGPGPDTINGQGGIDTTSYADASAAVAVNLSTSPGSVSGGAGADVLKSIENVTGSSFGDIVTGSALANAIFGAAGSDKLHGRDGNDKIGGGSGNDSLFGEAGDDYLDGGAGTDTCSQGTGTGTIVNCP